MGEVGITLGGKPAVLDPSGALWIAQSRLLVVADLHLEKASSYARGRTYLPPYDTHITLIGLARLILRRNPARVICLGDSFHDPGGPDRLGPARTRLSALQANRDWIWIAGNHDPVLPRDLGGDCTKSVTIDGFEFRHEPGGPGAELEIAGHLHPVAKIRRRGRSIRRRAFVTDGRRLILPAFGALTGGLNVLDPAFARILGHGAPRAYMLGAHQVYPMAPRLLRSD